MDTSGKRYVAVIDIGKTNKKVHIYDDGPTLVAERSSVFESAGRDGVAFEATGAVEAWLLETLSELASRYAIEMISVTTHGATFACVDATGELAIPVVDYTHEPGDSFHEEFYRLCGSPNELQRRTATPEFVALLNIAKGVRFLQTRFPDEWTRVRSILFYPQYFGFRITGRAGADFTYAACHTYLFDFTKLDYSEVADRLGIRELLPAPIRDPGTVLGRVDPEIAARTGLSPETRVTLGIHDSNSSLLPYLLKKPDEDLILNSTGTWCVAMHPEDEVRFAEEEIGKAVFYNMSATRRPVKTSILVGGLEFETYTTILRRRFGMTAFPSFDPTVYRDVVREAAEFILPAVVPGTGQFPDSRARIVDHDETFELADVQSGTRVPELFSNTRRAYAVLNLSLAIQTLTALRRVGLQPGVTVYTEGGFRNNRDYNALLASLAPEATFRLSGMPEATSFGASLVGWAALEGRGLLDLGDRFELVEEEVAGVELPGLDDYVEAFWKHLGA